MQIFNDDEAGYLKWVTDNPDGFVINAPKRPGSFPNMLHKANCKSITTEKQTNYTTTDFMKICSTDRQELINWVRDSGNLQECKHCKP